MKLSNNFSLKEFIFSPTAVRLGIENIPTPAQLENIKALVANILQPLRDHYKSPVIISSGFRGARLNAAVFGHKKSQHLTGQAADIEIIGVPTAEVWRYIRDNLPYDQLILEFHRRSQPDSGWVHVSYSDTPRREALSAVKRGVYLKGEHYVD